MALYKKLTISRIKEEVNSVKSFFFEGPNAENILYMPGQYLTFVLPTDFGEIRRSYSITSAPILGEPLSVAVKRIPNGIFSRYLVNEAKVGDTLLCTGAGGFFTFPENLSAYRQVFFFAAGTGITPIFPLIKTALYGNPEVNVVLVYSNRSPETTQFLDPLLELEKKFSTRLKIEFIYSISANLYKARLHKDFLKSLVRQYSVASMAQSLFYLCGPEHYMVMCTYGLGQLGVPDANIRKEKFTSARVVPKTTPPDLSPRRVSIRYQHQDYAFTVQYPDTINKAARKNGLVLPYSCEVGRCGNCVAKCTKGKVWMSYNEVLTERELEKGLVLTCVGYPVGGDVKLESL